MKNKLLIIFATPTLFSLQMSYGAVRLKKESGPVIATGRHESKVVRFIEKAARTLHLDRFLLPQQEGSETLGIVSLVLGILSIVFCVFGGGLLLGIPAIVTGISGMQRGHRGFGFALAGLILGIVGLVLNLLIWAIYVLLLGGLTFL